ARYVGDGLLVYFGYPYAHENDAGRATQAGLDIIDDLVRLNEDLARKSYLSGTAVRGASDSSSDVSVWASGPDRPERSRRIRLAVRIGIHSGLVVVGDCGGDESGELQVLGHTVNLAARLQGLAEPDSVVISAATLHLVRGLFVTHDLGVHH